MCKIFLKQSDFNRWTIKIGVSTKHWPPVNWPLTDPLLTPLLTPCKINGEMNLEFENEIDKAQNHQWDTIQVHQ